MFQQILEIPLDRQMWFLALFFWTLLWKGLALWKAARLGQKPWFFAFLFINTLGILEILYVYVFSNPRGMRETKAQ